MTIHRIRLLGDPVLRTRCETISRPRSTAVRVIMDDMRETLRDWQSRFAGGRGIAAPQIGAPVRMVYVDMGEPWPLINPEIVDIGHEDFDVWDDCSPFQTCWFGYRGPIESESAIRTLRENGQRWSSKETGRITPA